MTEETYLNLHQSEGIACQMASRILAAFISSGQLNQANEDELVERSAKLAIKLALKMDRMIQSDNEKDDRI
ncbi:MAG: hypothetical protein C0614_03865 [Desulfuromonas sp.]|nr:MAG: hypothetical protein C0614_03865 [Desulfuromonas sp.]